MWSDVEVKVVQGVRHKFFTALEEVEEEKDLPDARATEKIGDGRYPVGVCEVRAKTWNRK